jgi:hypothetical protein
MPHIRFDMKPDSIGIGRTAYNVTYEDDTLANWVGEVGEVRDGETEITAEGHAAMSAENIEHNTTILPKPAPVVAPSLAARVAALEAKVR